jgi:hemerythrin-like metal-binding protein
MGLIIWDHRLETGHTTIDEQHKELVAAYNRLHGAMKQGKGREELGGILTFLGDYTVSHFRMEEDLMVRHAYPQAQRHRDIHADLVKQVVDLTNRFHGGAAITLPVMDFLEDWLTKHIQSEDKRLAEHLRKA